MQVILHAGNAKDFAYDAIKKSKEGKVEESNKLLESANDEVTKAHQYQTNTLQLEAEGEEIPYLALFGHAQDTLMTTQSEVSLIKQMVEILNDKTGKENEK